MASIKARQAGLRSSLPEDPPTETRSGVHWRFVILKIASKSLDVVTRHYDNRHEAANCERRLITANVQVAFQLDVTVARFEQRNCRNFWRRTAAGESSKYWLFLMASRSFEPELCSVLVWRYMMRRVSEAELCKLIVELKSSLDALINSLT